MHNPGTRSNSRALGVISVAPLRSACPPSGGMVATVLLHGRKISVEWLSGMAAGW
jgi:hypothetical protein